MTLNAEQGVEVATDALWKYIQKYNIPSMFVVNKLDNERSDFWKTVEESKNHFGREVTVVQYPYSEGADFHAIIDVLLWFFTPSIDPETIIDGCGSSC